MSTTLKVLPKRVKVKTYARCSWSPFLFPLTPCTQPTPGTELLQDVSNQGDYIRIKRLHQVEEASRSLVSICFFVYPVLCTCISRSSFPTECFACCIPGLRSFFVRADWCPRYFGTGGYRCHLSRTSYRKAGVERVRYVFYIYVCMPLHERTKTTNASTSAYETRAVHELDLEEYLEQKHMNLVATAIEESIKLVH